MATRHITAQFAESLKEMCQNSKQTAAKNHAEHSKTRMAMDEQDVINIVEYVAESQNPFDLDTVPDELVNITTGQVASLEVPIRLVDFLEVAQKLNITFAEKGLSLTGHSASGTQINGRRLRRLSTCQNI